MRAGWLKGQGKNPMPGTFTIVIFCWSLMACGCTDRPAEKPADPPPSAETPKALGEQSSFSSKRGGEDLVESLY